MGDGYLVSPYALTAAAGTWGTQSETLRGGRKRLIDAEGHVGGMGPVVGPAATAWIDTWIDEVKSLADAAERHAEALEGAAGTYSAQDAYVEESLAQLLPWGQRHGTPPGPSGY